MSDWSSKQYVKFINERTQPAYDLAGRIDMNEPENILDIGCGPGNSTEILCKMFPNARVTGIDSSTDMIETARRSVPGAQFKLCDAGMGLDSITEKYDIVFSNACIQWIPDHEKLLKSMMGLLRSGGKLAVQTPMNFDQPIHKIIQNVATDDAWRSRIKTTRHFYNLTEYEYFDVLSDISSDFTIWKTTYMHRLKDHEAIMEWYRGTGLRPYLSQLSQEDQIVFEKEIFAQIVVQYPVQKNGEIVFPFPRFFFVAVK